MALPLARITDPWNVGRTFAQSIWFCSNAGSRWLCPAKSQARISFWSWLAAPCRRVPCASDIAIPAHRKKISGRACRTALFMAGPASFTFLK